MSSIPKKNLVDALTIYKSVLGVNEKVAIDVRSNRCFIDMNDSAMAIRISFDVDQQAASTNQLTMEADRLLSFVKGGKSDLLNWSTKKTHSLMIDKMRLSVPIKEYETRSWTTLGEPTDPTEVTSAHLFAQIAKTITPFSRGGYHNILESVCIRRKGKQLELLSTDGFRIGIVHITGDGLDELNDIDVIVPNKVLDVLVKLTKSDEPCKLFMSDKLFRLEVEHDGLFIEIAAAPIISAYPDVSPLLSKQPDHEWKVAATDLVQYCNLHKTVETNKRMATAEFVLFDDKIAMETKGNSEANSIIEGVKRLKGSGNYSIKMALRFMVDAIDLVALNGSEEIKIGVSTQSKMMWLRADSTNTSLKTMAIIVPISE